MTGATELERVRSQRDRLSRSEIEEEAAARLEKYSPGSSTRLEACPLELLIEKVKSKGKVEITFEEDLGTLPGNRKIFGEFSVDPLTIKVDRSLEPWGPRFRFTLAHELGHLALHRDLIGRGKFISRDRIPADTKELLRYGQMASFSDLEWVEWQANEFAASLLLPRIALIRGIVQAQESLGIRRNLGRIVLNSHPESWVDGLRVVADLLLKFGISRSLIWKRLRTLGLVEDLRGEGASRAFEEIDSLFLSQQA